MSLLGGVQVAGDFLSAYGDVRREEPDGGEGGQHQYGAHQYGAVLLA
jgi:hypothetical protein